MKTQNVLSKLKELYSATTISQNNQTFFVNDNEKNVFSAMAFYRLNVKGEFIFKLLFSNIIDTTYSDGKISKSNMKCDRWFIKSVRVCVVNDIKTDDDKNFTQVFFDGEEERTVNKGELLFSDDFKLTVDGEYLCYHIDFCGAKIPCLSENVLVPTFIKNNNEYIESNLIPVPNFIGCNKSFDKKIAFLGDSITQGIGSDYNKNNGYVALFAQKFSDKISFYNLGVGYARLSDASTLGIWAKKCSTNDVVFVCLGVNDIIQGTTLKDIKHNYTKLIRFFKRKGIKIILQSIPPFNFEKEKYILWDNANKWLKETLSKEVDCFIDLSGILVKENSLCIAKYEGHPNSTGTKVWADYLFEKVSIDL